MLKNGHAKHKNMTMLIIVAFIAVLLVVGCSENTSGGNDQVAAQPEIDSRHSPINGMVQSHDGGAVTISMEWVGVEDGSLVLDVSMNTHSVDLDSLDMAELAMLRDDDGNEYRATSWDSRPGGHHRTGVIRFPVPPTLDQGTTEYMELVIHDVAGVDERVLRWQMR